MDTHLFSSVDRALQQRARRNAAAAVREGQVLAAQRREAAVAVSASTPVAAPVSPRR
jgi:hypothetical protein